MVSSRLRPPGRWTAALEHSLLLLAPAVTIWLILRWHAQHLLGIDFTQEFWVASHRVLHGADPYAWSHLQIDNGVSFPYLAPTALFLVPLALVGPGTGILFVIALSMLALLGTLWALDVRDWRLYLFVFLWWPVASIWQTGNVTLLLGFGVALVWRYRKRPLVAGLLSAAIISLKPFVWPIVLWLLFTRRYRACVWTLAWGTAINAVAWGILGYGRIGEYLHLSATVTSTLRRNGYGLIALLAHPGAPLWAAEALMGVVVVALGWACVSAARRREDRLALLLCVLLMLAASPLVWNHYFALLIVPVALYRPRLSFEWAAGLLWWLCPGTDVSTWQAAVGAAVTVLIACCLIRSPAFTRPPRLRQPAWL
jgi:alpha-1,2-mannosyltransferase